ncbi:PA3715 family protein [Tenacibaculum aestuarii]|uniref:hypothetical protein n=1 Tax=Tenacibaculum aestuarii TaxID=362781 RepID=UPI003895B261
MKYSYLLIIFLLFSCSKNNKEKIPAKGAIEKQKIEKAVETVADEIEAVAKPSEHVTTTFKEELLKLKLKTVPLVDSTSFDSFIDENDYKTINAEAFQLPKVYKNWDNSKSNYRAIDAYRLNLSRDFYTVVVTVLQNEEVMESKLINYNIEGNVIASKMIAYDEIVESWARTKSTIESNKITIDYQYTVNENDGDGPIYSIVKIEPDGNFRDLGIRDIYYELVIKELNLDESKLVPALQAFKILPNSPHEAVVVIPEIVEGSEEEHYFALNAHVAFVNIENKQVLYHYFESAKTNGWISDAIMLKEIIIDTASYTITEKERAFGIKTHFVGSSRVNPYESDRLSLFIIENNSLQKVLHNFEVLYSGGEWDGSCKGQFFDKKKTLIISEEKTNKYFDIVVKNKITESIAFINVNGDCDNKNTVTTKTSVLKFDGKTYK